jgi:hypothetical protein
MVWHITRTGNSRYAYRVLERKPQGKEPLERPRHRWEYNTKLDLQEMGWGDID